MARIVYTFLLLFLLGCAGQDCVSTLETLNSQGLDQAQSARVAEWAFETNITSATSDSAVVADELFESWSLNATSQTAVCRARCATATLCRQVMLFSRTDLSSNASVREQLTETVPQMEAIYASSRICLSSGTCMHIADVERAFRTEKNLTALSELWTAWHATARPMRPYYRKYVSLSNIGAVENGYSDEGAFWRSWYDMSPADFEAQIDALWAAVKPLYSSLHNFVRRRLVARLGPSIVDAGGALRAVRVSTAAF